MIATVVFLQVLLLPLLALSVGVAKHDDDDNRPIARSKVVLNPMVSMVMK